MSTPARTGPPPSILDLVHLPGAQRVPRIVLVPSPAAGADWSANVPGGVVWELQSIRAQFVASAVVGSRVNLLRVTQGSVVLAEVPPVSAAVAGDQWRFSWSLRFGAWQVQGSTGRQATPLPFELLDPSLTVGPSTFGIDVGDQWSLIVLYVIELRPPLDADLRVLPEIES